MRRNTLTEKGGDDVESYTGSSQDTTEPTATARKPLAATYTDPTLDEVASSKLFPVMILLMEFSFSFVEASSEMYSIYALGGYTSSLEHLAALNLVIKYRYIGAIAVLPIGILCDSYIGTYYPLIFFVCLLTAFMGLHAVISLPMLLIPTNAKHLLAQLTFPIFGLLFVLEPLRLVTISRKIMESNYFRELRSFYALLAIALNSGIGAAGTILYYSLGSRYALCTYMFANFGLMLMYTVFYLVARRQFIKSTNVTQTAGTIGKAFAAIICQPIKYFDRYVLKKLIFKGSSEIKGDFRCFTLSQNTLTNAKAIVGIVLVTLPLIAAFGMHALVGILYYLQTSIFYLVADPYPLLSMKGYIFVILFPLVECWIFPALKKCSTSEASRQLTMVGTGAMVVSMAMCWSFVVHKRVREGNEFWYTFEPGKGHIAVTNLVNEPIFVRSQFMNYITDNDDGWTTLPPFKTFTVLNVPKGNTPFHFEYSSLNLATYDEYFLPVGVERGSWYVILPTGVFAFPPHCYRRIQKKMYVSSSLYKRSSVCAVCALTLCNGYVQFESNNGEHPQKIPLMPLTRRGTNNDSIEYDRIMANLEGEYTISPIIGGVTYAKSKINISITPLDTYLVVVYENSNETTWKDVDEDEVVADGYSYDSDLIQTMIVKTSPRKTHNIEWMYPTALFSALTDVLFLVSFWVFLFTNSPDQIRATVFSFAKFLPFGTYAYLYHKGALDVRAFRPMHFFYHATVNCFFVIMYFVCILFFIHKLFKEKPTYRPSQRPSVLSASSDEQKGK